MTFRETQYIIIYTYMLLRTRDAHSLCIIKYNIYNRIFKKISSKMSTVNIYKNNLPWKSRLFRPYRSSRDETPYYHIS